MRLLRNRHRVAVFFLALTACAAPAKSVAQGSRQLAIEAFEARTRLLGVAVPRSDQLIDTLIPFFPTVRFLRGTVYLEHGGRTDILVAADSVSRVFLLDSPASFRWLVLSHRPNALIDEQVAEYAATAARFSGWVAQDAQMVDDSGSVSGRSHRPVVTGTGVFRVAYFDMRSGSRLLRFEIQVDQRTGIPSLLRKTCVLACSEMATGESLLHR